ncbi:MAG: DoxX family protein [Flavobacteriales bacterium]|nr:DoxX family protein [Flavobacteriales bacterium]
MNKTMKIIGWVISGLIAGLLLFSAFGKLSGMLEVEEMFIKMGLTDWKVIIGIGEMVSAILFLIPKTQSLGTLLLSSYMGGAIVVHMQGEESILLQSAILVFVWIASVLRNPKTLSSFTKKR